MSLSRKRRPPGLSWAACLLGSVGPVAFPKGNQLDIVYLCSFPGPGRGVCLQGCCLARGCVLRVRAALEPPVRPPGRNLYYVLHRDCGQFLFKPAVLLHDGSSVGRGPGLLLDDGLAGRLVKVVFSHRALRLLAWAHLAGFRRQIPFSGGPLFVGILECLTAGCRLLARNRVNAAGRKQNGARAGQVPLASDWTGPLECPPLSCVEERFLQCQDTPWAGHVNNVAQKNIQWVEVVPKNLWARQQGISGVLRTPAAGPQAGPG